MDVAPEALIERARVDGRGLGVKFVKYSAVSVISVIVTQIVLILCLEALGWMAWLSNVIAVSIGSIPAYYLNRSWTWKKTGQNHLFKEVLPFWGMAFAGLALSTWFVLIADHWWPGSTLAASVANLVAFGALWFAKFAVLELVLFRTHHGQPAPADA